ncbi:MAG: MFS transporter [Acidobacteria bacterium]|nr:MFS transporter [Acidobacteriota bacterium]
MEITEQTEKVEAKKPGTGYAWYVVIVLLICYTLSFIDRVILGQLVAPIKRDLGISDTSIGLLAGFYFAIFYTLLGFPMGMIADRYSRRNLIAVGVFFWSLMTAVSSLATSFFMLGFARMGVGVGEATLGPSAFSMISDYFPKERLGGALSIYAMGIFIGSGLTMIAGGTVVSTVAEMPPVTLPVIGTIAAWRLTFLIVGLPGLLVALLVFTIREPIRRNVLRTSEGQVSRLTFGEIVDQLALRKRSVIGVSLGLSTQALCNYAIIIWISPYFLRVHNSRQAILVLGVLILTAGIIGMYCGGKLCDHWLQRGIYEAPLKVGVLSTVGAGVFFGLSMNMPNLTWLLILMAPAQFFLAMPVGSSYAALQLIFPNQLRGLVSALLLFTINLGLLTGTFLPGYLNDSLFQNEKMVGYSLTLTVVLASFLSATFFRTSYRSYRKDYELMQSLDQK